MKKVFYCSKKNPFSLSIPLALPLGQNEFTNKSTGYNVKNMAKNCYLLKVLAQTKEGPKLPYWCDLLLI